MKAIIIEDEPAAVKNLLQVLKEVASDIEIIDILDSVETSVAWFLNNDAPDLVFMDIQLADGKSFMIFDAVSIDAPVIFTTAYDEYVMDAFKVDSIDYLLKPIVPSEVERAISKYKRLTGSDKKKYIFELEKFISVRNSNISTLLIPYRNKLLPISVDQIACFYSRNEKVSIITDENVEYPFNKSLDTTIDKLDPKIFFRANRQFIIRHNSVKEIIQSDGKQLVVQLRVNTPQAIVISKARVSLFRRWMTGNYNIL